MGGLTTWVRHVGGLTTLPGRANAGCTLHAHCMHTLHMHAPLQCLYHPPSTCQFEDAEYEINPDANPFSPPKGMIPDPTGHLTSKHLKCLPASSVPWPETTGKALAGAACSANPGCAGLAGGTSLIGDCCPTTEGMLLGCCSDSHAPPAPPPEAPAPPPDSEVGSVGEDAASRGDHKKVGGESCDANSDCVNLGLTGDCCPSADGTLLGCCNNA